MSHKTRLNKLEKTNLKDSHWVLIGTGQHKDTYKLKHAEVTALNAYYASGGDRYAHVAFLPYDEFKGLTFSIQKSELMAMITNKSKNPAEIFRDSHGEGTITLN